MPWFLVSSLIFAVWAGVFVFLPRLSNEFGGIGYVASPHAEDWTRIVGLCALAFSVLLYQAHRSTDADLRRVVARGVLALTVPSALLMAYWQLVPDRRWIRADIVNIALLCLMSYGMLLHSQLDRRSPS